MKRPRRSCESVAACSSPRSQPSAAWQSRSRSSSPSTLAVPRRTAGESRCRPTRPSRSGCSRSSARASGPAAALMLTIVVVDDVVALVVIATVYTEEVTVSALLVAFALFGVVLGALALGIRRGFVYFVLGTGIWVAMLGRESSRSSSASRWAASRTPRLQAARSSNARQSDSAPSAAADPEARPLGPQEVRLAVSPTSASSSSTTRGRATPSCPSSRSRTRGSRSTATSSSRRSPRRHARDRRRLRRRQARRDPRSLVARDEPEPGPGASRRRLGGGRRRRDDRGHRLHGRSARRDARLRRLAARRPSSASSAPRSSPRSSPGSCSARPRCFPRRLRIAALLGTAEPIVDLYIDVDPERDHVRGPVDAPVTVVEYGDFDARSAGRQSPQSASSCASSATSATSGAIFRSATSTRAPGWPRRRARLRRTRRVLGDARPAARAPGRAARRRPRRLRRAARAGRRPLHGSLYSHAAMARVAEDVDGADLSGVSGTPTFFVNGQRHYGAYDLDTLATAVRAAGARATLTRS